MSTILKFADDTKLIKRVATVEEAFTLQEDLSKLIQWSKDWLMLFNGGKCKCLHLGRNNPQYDYFLGEERIESVAEESDLGVNMHQTLSFSMQCVKAVKKANQALGLIKKTIVNRDKMTILSLYKSVVRPHLEYCIQAWRPYLQRDIDLMEKVQRRATKLINGMQDLTYEERLKALGLTTLECRRLRGDLIETFKILKGYELIESTKFFKVKSDNTRGHSLKVEKGRSRLDPRKYSFSQRVVNYWNILPQSVIDAPSINAFKNRVDKYLRNIGGRYISLSRLPAPLTRNTICDQS